MAGEVLRKIVTEFVFKGNIKKIEKFEKSFKKSNDSINALNNSVKRTEKSFRVLNPSLKKAGVLLASYFGARVLFRTSGAILSLAGNMEQYQLAFETMLGSAGEAKDLLKDIQQFALKTPFGFVDAVVGAKRLMAFGESADTVVDSLKILGDIQSGTGADLRNLVLAYGQVRTAGILRGQEVRQFTEAGVPIYEELAKIMKVTASEIPSMISAGMISFDLTRKALEGMTKEGGRFFNLMEKQSMTFLGQWEKLKDSASLLAVKIGKVLIPIMNFFIKTLSVLLGNFDNIMKAIKVLIYGLGGLGIAFTIVKFKAVGAAIATAAAWAKANAAMLLVPALWVSIAAAIGLVIEDIVSYFKGKNSITGIIVANFKDAILYLDELIRGFGNDVITIFKFIGEKIWEFISWPFKKIGGLFDSTIGKIKSFFSNKDQEIIIKKMNEFKGGAQTFPQSTVPNPINNSNTNNNKTVNSTIQSPQISININGNGGSQSMIKDIQTGIQNGLQNTLNQSLRAL